MSCLQLRTVPIFHLPSVHMHLLLSKMRRNFFFFRERDWWKRKFTNYFYCLPIISFNVAPVLANKVTILMMIARFDWVFELVSNIIAILLVVDDNFAYYQIKILWTSLYLICDFKLMDFKNAIFDCKENLLGIRYLLIWLCTNIQIKRNDSQSVFDH